MISLIYLAFIIVIVLIGWWYIKLNNTREYFEGEGAVTTTPAMTTTTTEPNTTMANGEVVDQPMTPGSVTGGSGAGRSVTGGSVTSAGAATSNGRNLAALRSISGLDIPDESIRAMVSTGLGGLVNTLDRTSNLDVPITLNDEGKICNNWGNYNNGEYRLNRNTCMVVDNNSTERKCLSSNLGSSGGSLVSCGYLYQDGYIDNKSIVDITSLAQEAKQRIGTSINTIITDFERKGEELDKYIGEIVMKSNLDSQQKAFLDYNVANLDDKNRQLGKTAKEMENIQNELGMNKIAFNESVENNHYTENMLAWYYKIGVGMIIVLIIIVILNFAFSNVL